MANVSAPLRGVGCFAKQAEYRAREVFPSPCGVGVVSLGGLVAISSLFASVPLRGVGCFIAIVFTVAIFTSFRPLTGCGLFSMVDDGKWTYKAFPSPYGVWVVFPEYSKYNAFEVFPSPCGVGVVSMSWRQVTLTHGSFRPLTGCGLFWQSCTSFFGLRRKELSTLQFYCIILADGLSIAN